MHFFPLAAKPRMVHGARLEHWGVLGEWGKSFPFFDSGESKLLLGKGVT